MLAKVKSCSLEFFERLVKLLTAMGYPCDSFLQFNGNLIRLVIHSYFMPTSDGLAARDCMKS